MSVVRKLAGKSAVVTGSTSGIGLGVAKVLASHGANIILNGFGDSASIDALRKEISSTYDVRCLFHGADLSKLSDIEELVACSKAEMGSIDILVNNAGVQYTSPIQDFPVEKWDMLLNINLTACFHTMRLCLPSMIENGYGRIINVSSVHGLVGSVHKSAYVAAKHGQCASMVTIIVLPIA